MRPAGLSLPGAAVLGWVVVNVSKSSRSWEIHCSNVLEGIVQHLADVRLGLADLEAAGGTVRVCAAADGTENKVEITEENLEK